MSNQIAYRYAMHSLLKKYIHRSGRYFTVALSAFIISAGSAPESAWAFEAQDPANVFEAENISLASDPLSPSMADSCLPLLKSIHQIHSASAMDRNQRSAGKVAALGIFVGVRFALGPKEIAKSNRNRKARLDVWQTTGNIVDDRHALAVSDYRSCQKEKALKALSDFRWKR